MGEYKLSYLLVVCYVVILQVNTLYTV